MFILISLFSWVVPINTRNFAIIFADELVIRDIAYQMFPETWTKTLISSFRVIKQFHDRLMVILHALRITFCVSSPVDCYICGVTFGNCSMNIYQKNRDIVLLIKLTHILLYCNNILYCNLKSASFCLTLQSNKKKCRCQVKIVFLLQSYDSDVRRLFNL